MRKTKLPRIPAVSKDELAFAYAVGGAAAAGDTPQSGVAGMGANIDTGDGEIQRIELTDAPINRAAIAIRNQFPKGMLMPIISRIMAMNELIKEPEAEPYIRPAADRLGEYEISEAVFEVAARMPLNARMRFARKQFFRQVAACHSEDE